MYKITYLLVPVNEEHKKLFSKLNTLQRRKKAKDEINRTCRICLAKQDETNSSSLYNSNQYFPSLSISTAITECFGITLMQDESLSSFICSKCALITVEAYTFKNIILNTEKILNTQLTEENNVKKKNSVFTSLGASSSQTGEHSNVDIKHSVLSISFDHNYSKEISSIPITTDFKSEIILNETTKENQIQNHCGVNANRSEEKITPTKEEGLVKDSIRPLSDSFEKWWIRSNGPPYNCKICGRSYGMHYKAFYTHVRSHFLKKNPCIQCGKRFIYHKLIVHMRTHTKEKPYACELCPARFTIPGNLKRHLLFHTGEKPYVCDLCGKAFAQKSSMETHRQIHIGTPQFVCELCGKTFLAHVYYRKHQLKEHIEPDVNEKDAVSNDNGEIYKCNQCDRVFNKLQSLNQHYRIHGDAHFKCEICDTVLFASFSYDVHMYLHEVQMPSFNSAFDCKFCLINCPTKNDLELHLLEHIAKPYNCIYCKDSFDTKMTLNCHMRKYCEGRPFPCTYCKKRFKSATTLIQHTRIHTGKKPYLCQICLRSFTQQQQLSTHMLTHTGEKKYVCQYCGKAFALKGNLTVHIRRHTGTTPFYCDICGKGFYDSSSRRKHVKWKHSKENIKVEPKIEDT